MRESVSTRSSSTSGRTGLVPLDKPPAGASQRPVCRNVQLADRRTSVRMEPVMWNSLQDIGLREGMSVNEICSNIDRIRGPLGLTQAIRVFIVGYYRAPGKPDTRPTRRQDRPVSRRLALAMGVFC